MFNCRIYKQPPYKDGGFGLRAESPDTHRLNDAYKIQLRQMGMRLVYTVNNGLITVTVVAVGKRDRNDAYRKAMSRTD